MTVALALTTHDDVETADACVSFHLNLGVDLVLAADRGSSDGTAELLQAYAREGALRLLDGAETRARMAELAAAEGADWVLHASGHEFLWPRGADLVELLAAIPPRYKVVRGLVRTFPPLVSDDSLERRVLRLTTDAELEDARGSSRPVLRVAHRTVRGVVVDPDAVAPGARLVPLRGWYPIEVLRFPADESARDHGALVRDSRLHDALGRLRGRAKDRAYALPSELEQPFELPVPSVVDEAAFAADVAMVGEGDLDDLRLRLERVEDEVARLGRERSLVARGVGRALHRFRG